MVIFELFMAQLELMDQAIKSTLVKQMRIIYGDGYTYNDRNGYKVNIAKSELSYI